MSVQSKTKQNKMPKSKEQFEGIRESRKLQILDAALSLFAKNGVHKTSINQIAKTAKISNGLMYNYFEGKEDLLKQIILNGFAQLFEMYEEGYSINTKEEFKQAINQTFEIIKNNPEYWKLYYSVLLQPDIIKLVEKEIGKVMEKYTSIFMEYFKLKGSKDPFAETMLMGACLDGLAITYLANVDVFPFVQMKEMLIERFI